MLLYTHPLLHTWWPWGSEWTISFPRRKKITRQQEMNDGVKRKDTRHTPWRGPYLPTWLVMSLLLVLPSAPCRDGSGRWLFSNGCWSVSATGCEVNVCPASEHGYMTPFFLKLRPRSGSSGKCQLMPMGSCSPQRHRRASRGGAKLPCNAAAAFIRLFFVAKPSTALAVGCRLARHPTRREWEVPSVRENVCRSCKVSGCKLPPKSACLIKLTDWLMNK